MCTNLKALLQYWDLCAIDKKIWEGPNLQEVNVIMFIQNIKLAKKFLLCVNALTLLSIVGTSQDCKKSLVKKIGNKNLFS